MVLFASLAETTLAISFARMGKKRLMSILSNHCCNVRLVLGPEVALLTNDISPMLHTSNILSYFCYMHDVIENAIRESDTLTPASSGVELEQKNTQPNGNRNKLRIFIHSLSQFIFVG